ncbi:MAG: hypothetical protein WCS70_06815 [Verrucomicrobiota bacterium]
MKTRTKKARIIRNPAADQQWHARLIAKNGEPIAVTENRSSESGLRLMLARNFPDFEVVAA